MTEKITINRRDFYLTIDYLRIETTNGIETQNNQFVAFTKETPPNEINLGAQVKNDLGENMIFASQEQAREYVINKLHREIYPPDFLNPQSYTKENLSEIMNKELIFTLESATNKKINGTITGTVVECSLASNPPHLPAKATIILNNKSVRKVTFFEIKKISRY